MSLRARLISGLLAVAAVGLLLLGGITYATQRSFLLDRVDQQARTAIGPVSGRLDEDAGVRPGGGYARRDGPGGPPRVTVPSGTYGERRAADGTVTKTVLDYGDTTDLPPPRLPADVPVERLMTVPATGDSGLRYRVWAAPSMHVAGVTIAAVPMLEVDQTLDRLLLVEGLVIGGVLLALAALSLAIVRVGLRPLDRIAQTAGAIAAGDLSRRVSPATPRTEVGRLGLALNSMLARLERAFAEREASEDRLRRFLADASHELRTPLASIRGYAELFRMGAARSPDDVAKAMRRIEDEAARMGVLVEDLLALARLDEQRPAVRQEVDAADIAADAVEDARATAPDRTITLRAPSPAVLSGDPDQLRQVLANLLRNALVHTPDGTPVEVRADASDDRVRLTVRDHGPGLPPGGHAALFERFWRAEHGRERGRAGAGLGLAIVAGIVAAHHGTVTARDAAGGGAEFTVELPAHADRAALEPAASR